MRYTIKGKVTKYKQNIVCWRDVSAWPGQWRSFIRAHQCIFEISPFIFQSLNEWIFIIEKQKACVVCRREVTGGGQGRPEARLGRKSDFITAAQILPTHICPPSNIWFHHFQATTCSNSFSPFEHYNMAAEVEICIFIFLFRCHTKHSRF